MPEDHDGDGRFEAYLSALLVCWALPGGPGHPVVGRSRCAAALEAARRVLPCTEAAVLRRELLRFGFEAEAALLEVGGRLRWAERLVAEGKVVTRESALYPKIWLRRLGVSAPPALHVCGDRDALEALIASKTGSGIGVVGSRQLPREECSLGGGPPERGRAGHTDDCADGFGYSTPKMSRGRQMRAPVPHSESHVGNCFVEDGDGRIDVSIDVRQGAFSAENGTKPVEQKGHPAATQHESGCGPNGQLGTGTAKSFASDSEQRRSLAWDALVNVESARAAVRWGPHSASLSGNRPSTEQRPFGCSTETSMTWAGEGGEQGHKNAGGAGRSYDNFAFLKSRRPGKSVQEFCEECGREIARSGSVLVSGGAPGCDRLAAAACVDAGGFAIELLAWGTERWSPLPRTVALSALVPHEGFVVSAAMERNTWIYAASEFAVIGHARFKQGGSWHGAMSCLRRRLCPLVVRDDPDNVAHRALVGLGAVPIRDAHELGSVRGLFLGRQAGLFDDAGTGSMF